MKKSIILMILVVLIISTSTTYAQDVLATQKGPSQAEKGQNITVIYTITNNGNQNIFNVTVADQNFYKFFGTIKSGSKKIFKEKVYIPTDNELKEDFGDDATVSNPFFIGSIGVTYQDAAGKTFGINSNSISIPLVSEKPTENIVPVNITPVASSTDSSPSGIFQQIIDLFNSILQYLQNLFNPQNSGP